MTAVGQLLMVVMAGMADSFYIKVTSDIFSCIIIKKRKMWKLFCMYSGMPYIFLFANYSIILDSKRKENRSELGIGFKPFSICSAALVRIK